MLRGGEDMEAIQTKYGRAKIGLDGYYRITVRDQGNMNKLLHRLIFEDFYGDIPEGYVVHHKDGNRANNCILNLQLLSSKEHKRLHQIGTNNNMYGKSRDKSPTWKPYPRIIKRGVKTNGQYYSLVYQGKIIKSSYDYDYLEKLMMEMV